MAAGPVIHGGEVITTGPGATPGNVQGSVVFDNDLPASGVNLHVYNVGFGGNDTQVGQVATDPRGKYSVTYLFPSRAPGPQTVSLQMRALDPAGKEVPISATWFNAPAQATLNLVVPRAYDL